MCCQESSVSPLELTYLMATALFEFVLTLNCKGITGHSDTQAHLSVCSLPPFLHFNLLHEGKKTMDVLCELFMTLSVLPIPAQHTFEIINMS